MPRPSPFSDTLAAIAIVLAAGAIVYYASGCKSKSAPANPANAATGNAIAVTDAHLKLLPPHTDQQGQPILEAATKSNQAAAKENMVQAKEFERAIDALADEVESHHRDNEKHEEKYRKLDEKHEEKYRKLESKWYVFAGRWAERLFWIYVIIAVGGRVLSLFSGPWGMAGGLLLKATHIVNPAVWGLSLQRKWQAARAQTGMEQRPQPATGVTPDTPLPQP